MKLPGKILIYLILIIKVVLFTKNSPFSIQLCTCKVDTLYIYIYTQRGHSEQCYDRPLLITTTKSNTLVLLLRMCKISLGFSHGDVT